jgi:hypothetical protein
MTALEISSEAYDREQRDMRGARMGLDGPSRTIIVEPIEQPATQPAHEPEPERAPERTPDREREKVPA